MVWPMTDSDATIPTSIPVSYTHLPIIGALINGFGIADITDYIKSGVSTTWGMAALFVFVITYFGIMTDVGMFDKLVKKLIKIANGRVLGILLVVVFVSILGHLDGNSPTTYLIAVSYTHLDVYKRQMAARGTMQGS